MDPERTRWAEELIPDVLEAARGADVGVCPADDLLLGLVQGQLPEGVSETIRAHLAGCDTCQETAALLADEPLVVGDRPSDAEPPRTSGATGHAFRVPGFVLAAAACLALGIGVAFWWQASVGPTRSGTDERLVAAVQVLAATAPGSFSDFQVLGPEERRAPYEAARERGGLRLEAPRRRLLDPRPTFRWHAVAGADAYRLSVLDARGAVVWTRTPALAELPYPADLGSLARGAQYLWKVSTRGAMGPVSGRASFEVADDLAARRFEQARSRIVETAEADLVPLLEAHLAVRLGFLVHAWQVLDPEGILRPGDPVVQETRRYVARRLDLDPAK